MIRRFWQNSSASTTVEYCLIAGVISIVIVTAATAIGTKINAKFYGPLMGAFN